MGRLQNNGRRQLESPDPLDRPGLAARARCARVLASSGPDRVGGRFHRPPRTFAATPQTAPRPFHSRPTAPHASPADCAARLWLRCSSLARCVLRRLRCRSGWSRLRRDTPRGGFAAVLAPRARADRTWNVSPAVPGAKAGHRATLGRSVTPLAGGTERGAGRSRPRRDICDGRRSRPSAPGRRD
jgi:hypothetical protein